MFSRLPQINAIAGTIERDFALLAAALRTNPAVDGGTKSLFFSDFTDGAGQENFPVAFDYPMSKEVTRYALKPVQTGDFAWD